MALVSHLSAITGRVPTVHFMDGFRTSHELCSVEVMDIKDMAKLLPHKGSFSTSNTHTDNRYTPFHRQILESFESAALTRSILMSGERQVPAATALQCRIHTLAAVNHDAYFQWSEASNLWVTQFPSG